MQGKKSNLDRQELLCSHSHRSKPSLEASCMRIRGFIVACDNCFIHWAEFLSFAVKFGYFCDSVIKGI